MNPIDETWIDELTANNRTGAALEDFVKWYFETKEWRNAIETNNPDAAHP